MPAVRSNVRLHAGWFNETLPPDGLGRISFLRLDGDLYASTRDALSALYPLVAPGGIVYSDDYGSFSGCARAIDEYLARQPGPRVRFRKIYEQSSMLPSAQKHFEALWWVKPSVGSGS